MKWRKLRHIFDPTQWNDGIDRDWMKTHSQCPSAVIFENYVRVYFSCRPKNDANGQAKSYTTWLDLDRKDLTQVLRVSNEPVMPLGDLGCFDEHSVYPTSTIVEGSIVKLYYAGWYRCSSVPFNCAIGLALSDDGGVTFKRHSKGPILGPSGDEPFVLSGPKIRKFDNKYFLYYLAGTEWIDHNGKAEVIYKIKMATSHNGVDFKKEYQNIIPDVLDGNECQAGPDVFYLDGKYHMYFVYREGLEFRSETGRGYKIGYAHSNDLYNWTRDDAQAGIGYSETGWDSKMQHYPHIFEIDGNHYMIYNGNDFGKYGLGLAKLINSP
jgi:predicted GH43/DUF377 family glycosyl hydrolase